MKVSETFLTVQGEGPNVGKLTTFLRFGGCNLRCPGWGTTTLPNGEVVGACDTPYAVFPIFRSEWIETSNSELVSRVKSTHVCITGGEPLLQKKNELAELVEMLTGRGHTIDLFTNGSRLLPEWAKQENVTVCMDYKMPTSGEYGTFDENNLPLLASEDMLKFVVNIRDEQEKKVLYDELLRIDKISCAQLYVAPVWESDTQALIDFVMHESPVEVRLSIQSHKYFFPDGVDGTSVRTNQTVQVSKKSA